VTDTKKIELNHTNNALAELSDVLIKLNGVIDEKKNQISDIRKKQEAELIDNSKRLNILKNSSQNIIKNIDTVIMKLDKVLENDGTGNNNN
jgi:hypothetical protein